MYLISVAAKDGLMERPSIFIKSPGEQLLEVEGSVCAGGHRFRLGCIIL